MTARTFPNVLNRSWMHVDWRLYNHRENDWCDWILNWEPIYTTVLLRYHHDIIYLYDEVLSEYASTCHRPLTTYRVLLLNRPVKVLILFNSIYYCCDSYISYLWFENSDELGCFMLCKTQLILSTGILWNGILLFKLIDTMNGAMMPLFKIGM